ncbi:hypothetical protein [Chitinophaga solisilvae]|uniref:TonB-dependent receptor plug domain-containing protein n=1 Tax=Chitinophaga solisilvae TaxID=1233460 RepID=A0A9Q5DA75_9BACT|nr:hypothetical protein [Chitinophaga solisilvae]NSL87452.1 hypothetical protein [Chitinophaga solisilvae]
MKARIFSAALLLLSATAMAQTPENEDPVYVVDSVLSTAAIMENIPPDQIGVITIAKGRRAILKYGSQAANGVIYLETKPFARKRITQLLREASPAYDSLLRKYPNDSSFQYIVNSKLVIPTNETSLMVLDKKSLVSLQVVTARELEEKYLIKGRSAGVIITSRED